MPLRKYKVDHLVGIFVILFEISFFLRINIHSLFKSFRFAAVQAISSWTHKQLMSFGKKLWSENGLSQLREMFMDADTLSEISHTLEQDSERERSVQSLIDAQERISRTQKDSFSLLISKAKVALP